MKTTFEKRTELEIDFDLYGKPSRKYRLFYMVLFFVFLSIGIFI